MRLSTSWMLAILCAVAACDGSLAVSHTYLINSRPDGKRVGHEEIPYMNRLSLNPTMNMLVRGTAYSGKWNREVITKDSSRTCTGFNDTTTTDYVDHFVGTAANGAQLRCAVNVNICRTSIMPGVCQDAKGEVFDLTYKPRMTPSYDPHTGTIHNGDLFETNKNSIPIPN